MRHAATPLPDAVLSRSAIDEIARAYVEEARGNADAALRRAIDDALAQTLHAERLVSQALSEGSSRCAAATLNRRGKPCGTSGISARTMRTGYWKQSVNAAGRASLL